MAIRFPTKTQRLDHAELAKDPDFKPFLDGLALRSKNSSEVALRRIGLFLWEVRLTPNSLVALANDSPDELRNLLIEYAAGSAKQGYLGTYVRRILVSVKAYLKFRRSTFDDFPVVDAIEGESLKDERTPTPDELRALRSVGSLRTQTFLLSMAHAGLRPHTAAALCLGAMPDLDLSGPEPRFTRLPFAIRVDARLSKTRKSYLTFGGSEFAETLILYLRERSAKGETLTAASPFLASTGVGLGQVTKLGRFLKPAGEFVTTKSLTYDLRADIRSVRPGGQTFRPYTARGYCSTQMLIGESQGALPREVREHFLGHDTGVSGRYNGGKKLGPAVVEELRNMYARVEPFLSLAPKPSLKPSQAIMRGALVALRVPASVIDRAGELDEAKFARMTSDALGILHGEESEAAVAVKVPAPTPGERQRSVPNSEVDAWLAAGWEAVMALGDTATIVKPGAA